MSRRLSGLWFTKVSVTAALACALSAAGLSAADKLPTGTFVSGDWAVTFSPDKTYHVTQNGDVVVEGTYSVAHNQAVFKDTQGRYACSASDGKYTWKLEANALTFVKVEDDCNGRVGVLTGGPLTRQASDKNHH